jgi:hypothetical protein
MHDQSRDRILIKVFSFLDKLERADRKILSQLIQSQQCFSPFRNPGAEQGSFSQFHAKQAMFFAFW